MIPKSIMLNIIIGSFLIFFSCSNEGKKIVKIDEYINKDLRNFTYTEAQNFLLSHQTELDTVVSSFNDLVELATIIRREKSNQLISPDNKFSDSDLIKYSIICKNGSTFNLHVHANKESEFWDQNFESIKDYEKYNGNLNEYIIENLINPSKLKLLISFLDKRNVFLITKVGNKTATKINFSITEGLIFAQVSVNVGSIVDSRTETERVNSNWYYFKERF